MHRSLQRAAALAVLLVALLVTGGCAALYTLSEASSPSGRAVEEDGEPRATPVPTETVGTPSPASSATPGEGGDDAPFVPLADTSPVPTDTPLSWATVTNESTAETPPAETAVSGTPIDEGPPPHEQGDGTPLPRPAL